MNPTIENLRASIWPVVINLWSALKWETGQSL